MDLKEYFEKHEGKLASYHTVRWQQFRESVFCYIVAVITFTQVSSMLFPNNTFKGDCRIQMLDDKHRILLYFSLLLIMFSLLIIFNHGIMCSVLLFHFAVLLTDSFIFQRLIYFSKFCIIRSALLLFFIMLLTLLHYFCFHYEMVNWSAKNSPLKVLITTSDDEQ